MAKKKTTKVRGAAADMTTAMPRFATSISLRAAQDHFILDFVYGVGEEMHVLVGRYVITPDHAKRLRDLLARQIKLYEETKAPTAVKQGAAKKNTRRKVSGKKKTSKKKVQRSKRS